MVGQRGAGGRPRGPGPPCGAAQLYVGVSATCRTAVGAPGREPLAPRQGALRRASRVRGLCCSLTLSHSSSEGAGGPRPQGGDSGGRGREPGLCASPREWGVLCPSLRTNPGHLGRLGAGSSGGREPLLQPGPCRGQRGRACRLDRSPPPCPLWPRAPTAPALGTCPEGLSPQEALLLRPGERAGAGRPRSPRPTLLRAFRVGMTGPLGSVPGDKVLRGQSGLAAEAGGLTVLCGDRRL